ISPTVMQAALRGKRSVGAIYMSPTSTSSPLALRPRAAANTLGISPRTLWQWTRDGLIPCIRIGVGRRKTVLYGVADLETWLAQQAAPSKGGNHEAPK